MAGERYVATYEMCSDGSWLGTLPDDVLTVYGEIHEATLEETQKKLELVARRILGDDIRIEERLV